MKILILTSIALVMLAGCTVPSFDTRPMSDRQAALIKKSFDYVLPAQSVPPPATAPDSLLTSAVSGAYHVAIEQGLIADASDIANGMLVVGRKEGDRQMLVILQFYVEKDGRVGFEDTYKWKMGDSSAGERMRQKFISTLVNGK
jgi:hypothetical protein